MKQDNQKDNMKKDYVGEYNVINGNHYIRLNDDNGKLTLKVDTHTHQLTCMWDKHAIKRVVFDSTQLTHMTYQLPQSVMHLTVKTTRLVYQTEGNRIKKIDLDYQLWEEDTLFGQYKQTYYIY